MKPELAARWIPILSLALVLATSVARAQAPHDRARAPEPRSQSMPKMGPAPSDSQMSASHEQVRSAIKRHLGRPYVWGSSGLKSFDCSGFLWRVMNENGILIKRTTARKFYMSLPKVPDERGLEFGNVVFFSDLKHCGIVDNREGFYHAAVTTGTHLSRFDPFWRRKISGVRAMPGLGH